MSERAVTLATHARETGWVPAFLVALRNSANVRFACDAAGVARKTAYILRREDATFREQWDEAMEDALDMIEAAAFQYAMRGDASLIKYLLSNRRPDTYGERVKHDITINVRQEAERLAAERGVPLADVLAEIDALMRERAT